MVTRLLMVMIFLAGTGTGWLGKTWLTPDNSQPATASFSGKQNAEAHNDSQSANPGGTSTSALVNSNDGNPRAQNSTGNYPLNNQPIIEENSDNASVATAFNTLLNDRRYYDAILLYQEQEQRNQQTAAQLKTDFIHHLELLQKSARNADFSELIDHYLSIYYDDIDVLLLLAEFKQANSSYLEVVDVFLLAKTYAYTDADQEKVAGRFNNFVAEKDSAYTNQKNWGSLIALYSHINTSGLMTSTYQYRQALAHLQSGDEVFAIEQLNQLLNDSLVGQSAAITLNSLTSGSETPAAINSPTWGSAESIALQKLGNQYLVNLTNNQQQSINLLIDTGASMTAVTRSSFNTLNASGDAVEQERRDFQTANGVVTGTVYTVPELNLGPYLIKNTQIAVIDFGTERDIDGLLGMNILGQFQFQIDQENSRLLLNEK